MNERSHGEERSHWTEAMRIRTQMVLKGVLSRKGFYDGRGELEVEQIYFDFEESRVYGTGEIDGHGFSFEHYFAENSADERGEAFFHAYPLHVAKWGRTPPTTTEFKRP